MDGLPGRKTDGEIKFMGRQTGDRERGFLIKIDHVNQNINIKNGQIEVFCAIYWGFSH